MYSNSMQRARQVKARKLNLCSASVGLQDENPQVAEAQLRTKLLFSASRLSFPQV